MKKVNLQGSGDVVRAVAVLRVGLLADGVLKDADIVRERLPMLP